MPLPSTFGYIPGAYSLVRWDTGHRRPYKLGFAKITGPLHKLTEKQANKNFKWENEHDEAFKKLKRMLCSAPILALPNFENDALPFVPDKDASDIAVGGVLSQQDKEGR
ncbi:Retrovirus-related Pol polyprotein from transposon [Taenia solium]|eukprot:TsM_001006800 transcript=TsM_001006800 gene=TsM_001006800